MVTHGPPKNIIIHVPTNCFAFSLKNQQSNIVANYIIILCPLQPKENHMSMANLWCLRQNSVTMKQKISYYAFSTYGIRTHSMCQ